VVVSADGSHIASGGKDGTVRVWKARSGAMGEELRGCEGEVQYVLSANWSRDVLGGWDGMGRVWSAASGETVGEPLRGHEE
jgi:WD40 repeat protein